MTAVNTAGDADAGHRHGFAAETRLQCRRTAFIAGSILVVCFIGWSGFDRLLEPGNSGAFLVVRLVFEVPVIVATVWLRRERAGHVRVERVAFALLLGPEIAIAWMIGRLEGELEPYLLGYSLVIFGSAFLVVWHWRYTLAISVIALAMAVVSLWQGPRDDLAADLATAGYYLVTAGVLAVLCQHYRHQLAWREYSARADLLDAQARNELLVAELQQLSMQDGLTGLANRRAWDERLLEAFHNARRQDLELAVVVFDIDEFKSVNDYYGHPVGDEVLRGVAHALATCTRASDMVARIGGDEFTVLCLGQTADEAAAMTARVADAVRTGGPVPVTVSAGIAELAIGHTDPSELMKQADQALYGAKFDRAATAQTLVGEPTGPQTAQNTRATS